MSKLIQAVSIIALAAATSTAGAWYAPYQAPVMPQEQQQAMAAQQQAMMQQQTQAMNQAIAAQRQFAEQQAAYFNQIPQNNRSGYPGSPFGANPAFPEVPPMPEFGEYPSAPEMPPMPEFGQYPAMPERPPVPEFGQTPAMPEMPAMDRQTGPESMQARIKEMDAYRAQARQQMEARHTAMKNMREQRCSMMHQTMLPNMNSAPVSVTAPQEQAAAPADKSTATQ